MQAAPKARRQHFTVCDGGKRGIIEKGAVTSTMTPENQPVSRAELKAELRAGLEGFAAALIGNLSDLREEMRRRFAEVDKRLDTIDRRTERMKTHLRAIVLNTAGVN
jgi:hypothetical protein